MLLSLAAALLLRQAPATTEQPARLRTTLENGAVILVEPMARERTISVQLFASSRYVPESEATHGYRHLVEHLTARGPDGLLDQRLETAGCFLRAHTLRDAMQFEVTVGPGQLPLAIEALGSILKLPAFTQEAIDKEVRVMREEIALQDSTAVLASAAWSQAYGQAGLDPVGTFDSMYRATPEKLLDTYTRQFSADGLVLTIAGPVSLDSATTTARAILQPLLKRKLTKQVLDRKPHGGRVTADTLGEARAAMVPAFWAPQTVGALAAALVIASDIQGGFVTYTPTAQAGLILVGRTNADSGVGLAIEAMDDAKASSLYARGKALAREWVVRQLRTASGVAYLRGLLLCQSAGYRPEQMLEQIDAMTSAQFLEGFKLFKQGKAVTVVGSR